MCQTLDLHCLSSLILELSLSYSEEKRAWSGNLSCLRTTPVGQWQSPDWSSGESELNSAEHTVNRLFTHILIRKQHSTSKSLRKIQSTLNQLDSLKEMSRPFHEFSPFPWPSISSKRKASRTFQNEAYSPLLPPPLLKSDYNPYSKNKSA